MLRKVQLYSKLRYFASGQYLTTEEIRLFHSKIFDETKVIVTDQDDSKKYALETRLGTFSLDEVQLKANTLEKIEGVYYLSGKHSKDMIKIVLKQDPFTFLILDNKITKASITQKYQQIKQNFEVNYFGTQKIIRNPFRNCENYLQIYHLNNKINQEIYSQLNKILVLYQPKISDTPIETDTQDILTENQENQEIQQMQESTQELTQEDTETEMDIQPSEQNQNLKLISISQYMDYIQYNKKKTMTKLKILKFETFFLENSSQYLNHLKLFEQFFQREHTFLSNISKSFEIGFDSGVISLALKMQFPNVKNVLGIDKNPKDVKSIYHFKRKMAWEGRFQFQQCELNEDLMQLSQLDFRKRFKFNKFELIICKAPYIPRVNIAQSELQNQQKLHQYHNLIFQFVKKHLSKKKGKFLFLYCDLGAQIQLQSKKYVECLCEEHELKIVNKSSIPLGFNLKDKFDPLKNLKMISEYTLYEIEQ